MARILLALLFLSACLEASVTAAWKIPVEHFAPDYKTNAKIRKLEKPPGDSDFLQPGDELWDLSKGLSYRNTDPLQDKDPLAELEKLRLSQPWYGEWLVWNSRSGMVVARGSWNDIFAAQKLIGFEDVPVTIRTRVELVTGDKEPVVASLTAGNDEQTSVEENGLQVDLRVVNLGPPGLVDGQFLVSWPAADKDSRWEVNTAVTLKEGTRTRLARRGRGPSRGEVFATATREFSKGVKVSEARLIEGRDGVSLWPMAPDGEPRVDRLGDGSLVWSFGSSSGFPPIRSLKEPSATWPQAETPAARSEWVRGQVVDLRGLLTRKGAELKGPDALAVFDPGSGRVTVAGTPEDIDFCEMAILQSVLSDPVYGKDLWVEMNPEAGGWGLTCRSGEKAWIAMTNPAGNVPSFEIEPMIGGNGRIVGLHYELDVFSKGAPAGHVKSSTELELGKPQEIAGHSTGQGREKVILTVSEN